MLGKQNKQFGPVPRGAIFMPLEAGKGVTMQRFINGFLSLDTLAKPSNGAAAVAGIFIGPFLGYLLTNGKFWTYVFLLAIVAGDWLAGTAAAKKTDTYRSEYGISAVYRTLLLLWIPIIGWLLDMVTLKVFGVNQPGYVFYGLTLSLAYHSWESMTANSYRAGWDKWIPKSVLKFVSSEIKAKAERALKQKGDRQ